MPTLTDRRAFLKLSASLFVTGAPTLLRAAGPAGAAQREPTAVPTIDQRIGAIADAAPLALQFEGGTAEDCHRWQQTFSAKLRTLLGPHRPPKRWKTVRERVVELDDHRREELILTADGHPPLPVYLLIPTDRTASRPNPLPEGEGAPERAQTVPLPPGEGHRVRGPTTGSPATQTDPRPAPKVPRPDPLPDREREKVAQRRPAVLAIHGHGAYGYDPVAGRDDLPGVAEDIEKLNYDYGRQLVRRGYVVAAPCLTPFGRRLGDRSAYGKQDPCAVTFVRLQLLGKVLMAENLRDTLWALALLAQHEAVDPERLGCVGLSYGGRMTMLTTALEPRVRVAVVSGALNVMQERITHRYSCGAQVIPGLLRYGDTPEIGSLIAPRPCVWEVGSRDPLIPHDWAEAALARIRRAYRAFGAEELGKRLQVDRFEGGHAWSGRLAYPLLEEVLRPPRTT